jgi:hypothetical protein
MMIAVPCLAPIPAPTPTCGDYPPAGVGRWAAKRADGPKHRTRNRPHGAADRRQRAAVTRSHSTMLPADSPPPPRGDMVSELPTCRGRGVGRRGVFGCCGPSPFAVPSPFPSQRFSNVYGALSLWACAKLRAESRAPGETVPAAGSRGPVCVNSNAAVFGAQSQQKGGGISRRGGEYASPGKRDKSFILVPAQQGSD